MSMILGIDPGYGRMGYAVLSYENTKMTLIEAGCIETSKEDEHAARLSEIASRIRNLFDKYQPEKLGIEKLFFSKNQTTAIAVAESRGVVLAITGAFNIPVFEFNPKQVKLAVTGYGNAEKKQVQEMVKRILNLKEVPRPDDAADAVAVAIATSSL